MRRLSRGARGTALKTGQATRERHRVLILAAHGPYCWLCLAGGKTLAKSRINLRLRWPHPRCFTRDHVIPRALGGTDDLCNLRPAHHVCNAKRGSKDT